VEHNHDHVRNYARREESPCEVESAVSRSPAVQLQPKAAEDDAEGILPGLGCDVRGRTDNGAAGRNRNQLEEVAVMKQAKPSAAECQAFLRFMKGLESIFENHESPDTGDDPFNPLSTSKVYLWLENQWHAIGPIWQRVYFAGQMAIDNTCDPNADMLEWRDEIKEAAEKKIK
jgi:hypothetical protein